MNKDWDFYKKQHIEDTKNSANLWLQNIEMNIKSPIERIAFMHLIYASNQLFSDFEMGVQQQVKIGGYIVDFLVSHWDTDTQIIIECDGHDFHERTKEQAAHDKKRDRFFSKLGYIVLRYTGSQICSNPMEIYEDVGGILLGKKRQFLEREGGG